jgi:flagellar biosynthesis protein FlhG
MVKTIAISSGKGGVGKTSLAVNSSVRLSMEGKRVALLDADFGMANSHILLDQKVKNTVQDILEGNIGIDEVVHETSSGLQLIPGGSGILELLNLDSKKRWEIIRSLDPLQERLDYLIVDTPAGASDASIEFAAACDKVIVVLVPEPTSFMDAYAFIKALNIEKNLQNVSVVVNLAGNASGAKKSFESFKKIVTKFLSIEVEYAGWLPKSSLMASSIVARKPVILNKSLDRTLKESFNFIAKYFLDFEVEKSSGIKFFNK